MSTQVDQYIEKHLNDSVAELSRLCAQPSVSAQGLGIHECAELVAQMLRARGFTAQIHPTRGHPIITAEIKGKKNKTLIFYNHYDVQPPEPLDLGIAAVHADDPRRQIIRARRQRRQRAYHVPPRRARRDARGHRRIAVQYQICHRRGRRN